MKIKGIEFSEETIVGWAKQAGVSFEEPKYQFKAWDIAENDCGYKRIIIWDTKDKEPRSFDPIGCPQSQGQAKFENHGYKKIGELKDYIK